MKTAASLLLLSLLTLSAQAGWFGPGPWANDGYYPGYLNGKYVGLATPARQGDIISGVIGFAIVEGAPPFRQIEEQSSSGAAIAEVAIVNQQIEPDILQNYFALFVEGRTYVGLTWAAVDLSNKTVSGALQGQIPSGTPSFSTLEFGVNDALPIINRGLSGGFDASIDSNGSIFTFSGKGNLSTPSDIQTYQVSAFAETGTNTINGTTPVISEVVTGVLETETTPFLVRGTRTSFISSNPATQQDQINFSQGSSGQ